VFVTSILRHTLNDVLLRLHFTLQKLHEWKHQVSVIVTEIQYSQPLVAMWTSVCILQHINKSQVTRLYFTCLPRSPCGRICSRFVVCVSLTGMWIILLWSLHRFWFIGGSKFTFLHWLVNCNDKSVEKCKLWPPTTYIQKNHVRTI